MEDILYHIDMERTEIQQRKPREMVTSLIDWLHEKGIYELAVASMGEPTSVLSETMVEMVEAERLPQRRC